MLTPIAVSAWCLVTLSLLPFAVVTAWRRQPGRLHRLSILAFGLLYLLDRLAFAVLAWHCGRL